MQTLEREQASRRVADRTGLLRYAIQMFGGGDEHLETMGAALESLLDPERQVAEGDEFALTTTNHLLPKLVFACNTVDDFLKSPESFSAHISVFLGHFNARSQLGRIDRFGRGSYVAGLLQEPEILLEADSNRYRWSKGDESHNFRHCKGWEADLCGVHSCVHHSKQRAHPGRARSRKLLRSYRSISMRRLGSAQTFSRSQRLGNYDRSSSRHRVFRQRPYVGRIRLFARFFTCNASG